MDKRVQTTHPLGFNDTIYHEGNISRLSDFTVFSRLNTCKQTSDHMQYLKYEIKTLKDIF